MLFFNFFISFNLNTLEVNIEFPSLQTISLGRQMSPVFIFLFVEAANPIFITQFSFFCANFSDSLTAFSFPKPKEQEIFDFSRICFSIFSPAIIP